ncbi:hypothetical protein [Marinifilum fragile]|uniref:hypothetical protein n=1 Tax=Marinifilum fragile TaxID=570161 RepID=UPI002AAAAB59|nr:hypothetical protein [Marinifilum fragile]
MKTAIIILGLICSIIESCYSQCEEYELFYKEILADTTYLVEHENFIGYIFPENYHGHIVDKKNKTFTLSKIEVLKIESILLNQYNLIHKSDSRVIKYKRKKNVGKYLRKFDRQYLGFINESGEKSAAIILANRHGKGKYYFECFERVMTFGFGEFYEKNQRYFVINLDKEKLIIP